MAALLGVAGIAAVLLWQGAPGAREDGLSPLPPLDDIDAPRGELALILHPAATGNGLRGLRDDAVIRAAWDRIRYTAPADDTPEGVQNRTGGQARGQTGVQTQGRSRGDPLISVLAAGAVTHVFRCQAARCRATGLEPLRDASVAVAYIREEFAHHAAARKRHWALLGDPAVLLVEPPNLPAPSTIVYPARVTLELPTIVPAADAPGLPDIAIYRARFAAAFAHAFPDTEAYRIGEISLAERQIGTARVIEPLVSLEVIPALKERLFGAAPFAAMPAFSPATAAKESPLPVPSVDLIRVTEAAPLAFPLTYYRIHPDEPAAQ